MFKFTLSEKFKQRGVSPDAISPEMRNRFDAFFNENGASDLDRRIQVRLDETVIRFFFYKDNTNADVLIEDKYQEIASISLNNVKETGYDILYFKEKIERKCPEMKVEGIVEISKNLVGYPKIKGKKLRMFNFPFVDSWNFNDNESSEKWFAFFMQCCFLQFLFEFENIESDFPNSPIYDKVREKLRESEVYQLLCAKVKYTIRLYEYAAPLGEEDYNTIALKYADLLMDKNQNKVVPHDYYMEQLWFYNPESELDFILQRNTKNCKKRGEAKLSDKIYGKFRDFFFTRHAIASAMGNKWTRTMYWLYFVVICAFSVFATLCLLNFDSDSKTVIWFFKHIVWWDWIAAGALGVLVVLWGSIKSLSVFMPRVLVAIGIGWLTTFLSEDLIKSQVSIDKLLTIAACIGVIFLMSLLLLGEIRKYSPYYFGSIRQYHEKLIKEKDWCKSMLTRLVMWIPAFLEFAFDFKRAKQPSSWKLTPILIHSYFWALTLGVVMQLAMYKDLLEHSKVLPEVVFEQTFEKADNYVMYLNNLRDVLVSYEDDWKALCSGSSETTGTSKDINNLAFIKMYPNPDFNKYEKRFISKKESVVEKYERVESIRDKISNNWIEVCQKRDSTCVFQNIDSLLGKDRIKDSLTYYISEMMLKQGSSSEEKFKTIVKQLLFLDNTITNVENEIRNILIFKSNYKNWDSLIDWSDYNNSSWKKSSNNIKDCLMQSAICEKNLCRRVKMWWIRDEEKDGKGRVLICKEVILFPRMLIFHSLIVLIIAFVGNLIISDKSVTEPL